MSCFRVKYRIEYDSVNDLYRFPKAPELVKIAHSVATDVFYDSSNDYEPEWVDITALEYGYGGQWFFNVADEKNMFVTSEEVTGVCLNSVHKFIGYTVSLELSDIPGVDVDGTFVPDSNTVIK